MLPFREMLDMLLPPSVYYRRRIAEEVDAGEPELDLLPELVRRGSTAVDVGANQGFFWWEVDATYWVLRALPGVRARVPGVRLEIIGDGPYGPTLEAEVARRGLQDAVRFLGFMPGAEKVRHLQASWGVLQPSPKEGWGLTVVESSACGTAVIASDAPGLRDSVRRDETGLLVPYDDTAALTEAIVRLLTDASLRRRLESAGPAWAARFQWDECGRRSIDALVGEGGA